MPNSLKTDWKRIGRSGPTVDGRTIEPTALEQAAANYDKQLFTALIWPDHLRWFNMGTVEEVRAEANDEGGMDLFALIAPNDYYLSYNKSGQYLFTSMELLPNFRDTGEWYLAGLAATDNPASAATSEMRFSAISNKDAFMGQFIENTPHQFAKQEPAPSWFTHLFKKQPDEDTMSKAALEALAEKFTHLEEKINALSQNDNTDDNPPSDDYAALVQKVDDLALKLTALEQDKGTDKPDDVKTLMDGFTQLRADFDAAINEQAGTDAGEHNGDTDEFTNSDYQ